MDKAREKLEQEDVEAGTPQDKVKELCLLWLSVSVEAVEMILTDGKTIITGTQGKTAASSGNANANASGSVVNATDVWRENAVKNASNFNAGKNRGWTFGMPNTKKYW